jgi:ArsR family transcriptional regulator, lead/cadmium/zinc/bismuth-responsive transcriptional repressor
MATIHEYMSMYSDIAVTPVKDSEVLSPDEAHRIAELFGALSDPGRVRIVAALLAGDLNVSALAERVELSESAVSHQLRTLRQLRLVRATKLGREVFYALDDDHVSDLLQRGLDHVRHGYSI